MRKINTGVIFPLIAMFILLFALSNQLFEVPPLGKVLNPFIGAVQNDQDGNLTTPLLKINGAELKDSVNVYFDHRKVPHIYAKNEKDLFFAQGYVTASLRLWQMDFLSYVSSGRLSEVLDNPSIVDYDRNQRRLGILEASKLTLRLIESNPETNNALTAYVAGVNYYIKSLDYKGLPFEYKLLNYEPEPWSKLKSILVMKMLGNTLTGYDEDLAMSKLILALGNAKFNALFPDFNSHSTPVMNNSKPNLINSFTVTAPAYLNNTFLSSGTIVHRSAYNPKLGSNSWAVSGKKTKSGFPILASDPHLSLALPSFWLEMQLVSPDRNVYGVSIPGTPAIIIGFNKDIAWGITNGADDVRDWYKLRITDDYKKYELNGKWIDLKSRVEEIKRKGHSVLKDTVYSTVHGPIVITRNFQYNQPELTNYALKWELNNPSNEFLTFISLGKAKNYADYKNAIKTYACPSLNFTFACKDNTIAINHQGRMAIKQSGQGKFIMDGSRSDHGPIKYIPVDSLPMLLNPDDGYVLSANQHPTFPDYKYYYNGYYSETRANRIQDRLKNEKNMDVKTMESIQLDNVNDFALKALPVILNYVNQEKITKKQSDILKPLALWKGTYDLNDKNAELFELWWKNIKDYTWDEFEDEPVKPADYTLLDLIVKDPANEYFKNKQTLKNENAGDIITNAFITAASEYAKLQRSGSVRWGDINKVSIMHMINIPAFSVTDLSSAGHPEAINAISKNWGPTWRMIVQLGERPLAYGIYPGGQDGNIGSKYYDSFVKDWNIGKYYKLDFFLSQNEAMKNTTANWILK